MLDTVCNPMAPDSSPNRGNFIGTHLRFAFKITPMRKAGISIVVVSTGNKFDVRGRYMVRLILTAILLWIPRLAQSSSLNTGFSVTCGASTITGSASVSCFLPDGGEADALGGSGDITQYQQVISEAASAFNDPTRFAASGSITASYQITFFGSSGPGYLQATLCSQHDPTSGSAVASLVTSNGSIVGVTGGAFGGCSPPASSIPITFGVPLDVALTLTANSGSVAFGHQGNGFASFSGFQVLNGKMQPVNWTAVTDLAPEPSTVILTVPVLFGFLLYSLSKGPRIRVAAPPEPQSDSGDGER